MSSGRHDFWCPIITCCSKIVENLKILLGKCCTAAEPSQISPETGSPSENKVFPAKRFRVYGQWYKLFLVNTLLLVNKFYKSSPASKYKPDFLHTPLTIYSCVSTTSLGNQLPQMWRLVCFCEYASSGFLKPYNYSVLHSISNSSLCFHRGKTVWARFLEIATGFLVIYNEKWGSHLRHIYKSNKRGVLHDVLYQQEEAWAEFTWVFVVYVYQNSGSKLQQGSFTLKIYCDFFFFFYNLYI